MWNRKNIQTATPITPKQLQLIHIAKSKLGLDDETYRETLLAKFNVSSSKELTYYQAELFIGHLKKAGFKVKRKKTTIKMGDKVIVMATPAQRALIDVLKANIVWQISYQVWLEKRLKLKKVMTSQDAQKVIEGLKGMLKIKAKHIEFLTLPFPAHYNIEEITDKWFFDTSNHKLVYIRNGEICQLIQ